MDEGDGFGSDRVEPQKSVSFRSDTNDYREKERTFKAPERVLLLLLLVARKFLADGKTHRRRGSKRNR